MTEHELFRKTFSTLHASPDTLMEVQKAMENNKKTHRTCAGVWSSPSPPP